MSKDEMVVQALQLLEVTGHLDLVTEWAPQCTRCPMRKASERVALVVMACSWARQAPKHGQGHSEELDSGQLQKSSLIQERGNLTEHLERKRNPHTPVVKKSGEAFFALRPDPAAMAQEGQVVLEMLSGEQAAAGPQ
ncbi:hypothetical protein NDU88_006543 [Pleurodeles waltl]|uniref:Uncharacterized protein n=1 Tax=Pleurodeles waltl TaxID=8319 RepID=A0AAV7MCJ7_PLEWA|nr:hypothetical protein NDU88_006543 [Pleurodeles waltl]